MQVKSEGISYFSSPWNYLDVLPATLIILTLVTSYFITFPEYERPINAIVGMMLWLKFLYFLRIFRETGHFITMILAVLSDMKVFMAVYFVVIIAFANAFYILSNNNEADS
jgi:hypothetical protein